MVETCFYKRKVSGRLIVCSFSLRDHPQDPLPISQKGKLKLRKAKSFFPRWSRFGAYTQTSDTGHWAGGKGGGDETPLEGQSGDGGPRPERGPDGRGRGQAPSGVTPRGGARVDGAIPGPSAPGGVWLAQVYIIPARDRAWRPASTRHSQRKRQRLLTPRAASGRD